MAKRGGGTLRFVGATAAGAIIGVLAIRAFDKHVLKKGDPDEPEALPPAGGQQPSMFSAPMMPVFLPSLQFMPSMAPLPTSAPSLAPPTSSTVSQEEIDIVDEIESEWDSD